MPLNPLIALSAQTPNIGGQLQQFTNDFNANLQNQQRTDALRQKSEAEAERFRAEQAEKDLERAQKGYTADIVRVAGLAKAGQLDRAVEHLTARRGRLVAEGRDPSDTEDLIRLAQSNPDAFMTELDVELTAAERMGLLEAVKDTSFTLTPGAKRFDSQGNEIAGVDFKPDTKSPEAIAQERAQAEYEARLGAKYRAPAADPLVEIGDPSSPTGTRFVPRSQAVGQPGKPPSGTSLTVGANGEVVLTQGRQGASGQVLTPGQKKVDQDYAKEYVAWRPQGGAADAGKNLEQLKEVAASLERGANLTGPVIGLIPDLAKAFTNPESISVREAAEEVVQRNLRLILGAQFTEKEGERLIARAFNPRMSEAENAKRIGRLIKQIESASAAKDSAADYFEKEGTLDGWIGRLPNASDFSSLKFDEEPELSDDDRKELEALRKSQGG